MKRRLKKKANNRNWFVYCRNNPLKYKDLNGMEIDTSELIGSEYNLYNTARNQLIKTKRGREIINNLEKTSIKYIIQITHDGRNGFNPKNKTITWDPDKIVGTGDDKTLSPETLLMHEMGHAEQDRINPLPLYPSDDERIKIENENIIFNENPVAKERGDGIRNNYFDWTYSAINGKLDKVNKEFNGPMSKKTHDIITKNSEEK